MKRINYYVRCSAVLPGLRSSEATVEVTGHDGKKEYVRASLSGLYKDAEGVQYLCIGLIGTHQDSKTALVQFPQEADSGANRIWVTADSLTSQPEAIQHEAAIA